MRILLTTIGSRGDVQPLAALARQMLACGHEARLCVPPDFGAWLLGLGLPVTCIGPELRPLTAIRPQGAALALSPERRQQLADASVAAQFATLLPAAEGCDVIVAASALQIAARSVAERLRARYHFVAYCPIVYRSSHHPPPPTPSLPGERPLPATATNAERWSIEAARFQALFAPALNSHRAALGLAAVSDVREHIVGERGLLAADAMLAPWPDAADASVVQTGAWLLEDERPLTPDVEAFLDEGDPPIYFGFGSIRAPSPAVAHVVVDAARAVGRRAIVSRGWAGLTLPDAAPDCRLVDEVNQRALFRRVSVVVHHGGAGTTTAAAISGTPQLVIPQMYDQHYWAARVEDLGVGAALPAGAPETAVLVRALERALRPEATERAAALAQGIRRDGVVTAARLLLA